MKTVPENDFAIVIDTERKFIISCGSYSQMVSARDTFNHMYQSTAYKVQRWNSRAIYL